jgi:regulator of protease activity HflC (stomatin/prohibitin superfamily)
MIGIITFIIVALFFTIFFKLYKREKYVTPTKYGNETNPKGFVVLASFLIVSAVIAILNPYTVERVDSGYVAILVENVGDNKGMSKVEYKRGWVFYNSFTQRYYEFPVYQQHIEYSEATVITKGGFETTIKPSFNYSLNPSKVDNMFQNLRVGVKEMEQGWLMNAVLSSVNDVANQYTVDSIFNHRAEFEASIVKECNRRVGMWFSVSQMRTNITPPDAIKNAIIEKTKSVQEAQAALQRTVTAQAEAQEKIARAKGDSAQNVIAASGRAEAMRREQLNITPLYIEYLKTQKWKGEVPQTVLGSNTSTLLNIK